jgi:hypothetical protein
VDQERETCDKSAQEAIYTIIFISESSQNTEDQLRNEGEQSEEAREP